MDVGQHRIESRSVSWNSDGDMLATACSDRTSKLVNMEGKELQSLTGHQAPVLKTCFHSKQPHKLLTSGQDKTIRIWDVRHASHKANGTINLKTGNRTITVAWSPIDDIVVHTEEDATVLVHDVRDLSKPLQEFALAPCVVETCIYSPDGNYLVAGTSSRTKGMADLRVWNDKEVTLYPAHVGPIYAAAFSPDGSTLATGGADATVGIWNSQYMVCRHTVIRQSKFIRSVAFSADSQLLATASEDDGVDVADASDGTLVGIVTFGHRAKGGGAEEVAFHPKDPRVLACARISQGPLPVAPVTIAKLNIEAVQ